MESEKTLNLKTLFEQVGNNNPKAFQMFFDYSYAKIFRFTSYFLNDPDDCKDVISEVYYQLWLNRSKLTGVNNVDNYLFICVRNQALYYLRESNRFQKIGLEDVYGEQIAEYRDPERKMLDEELRETLELAINSLPQRCRQIFFLVKEEEMKYRDVAKCLSISERTVHAQMCIALKRIAHAIEVYRLGKRTNIRSDENDER